MSNLFPVTAHFYECRNVQFTIDQKKHKEEANHNLQAFLAALKPSILLLHSRIGCPEVHSTFLLKLLVSSPSGYSHF